MLGEVSKQKELKNVRRIIASKEEMLTALFERTYSEMSFSAKRIILTLCGWRNILPEVAIQAILSREENEKIDVESGIEELFNYSFIELPDSSADKSIFISVPLTTFEFGKRKLSVSPLKSKIQLDIELLNHFGITQFSDISKGLKPKIEKFFKNIAMTVRSNKGCVSKYIPILNFICRKYPEGWIMLYKIYYEIYDIPKAIETLQNFIADYRISDDKKIPALEALCKLYVIQNDPTAEAQTLVDICNTEKVNFNDLSNAVHCLMTLFKENKTKIPKEERYILLNSVAEKMDKRMKEGSKSDYTKLAWVYLHLENRSRAKSLTNDALKIDPRYPHALNLVKKLKLKIKLASN